MAGAAAIFDLDRTLLKGSSATAFDEAYFEVGLTSRRSLPGQGLMMRAYEVFGETLPSMALARAAALASRDKPVDDVVAAGELAATSLERDVASWARALLASHHDAGRHLVLATTSPYDLVKPLADRLGFDHVIATHYATRIDHHGTLRYTGGLDGGFVWANGKLAAVRRWARAADVELRDSWAYSDSIYDLPLFLGVGHPTAVNPDYRLHAAAILRRWPVVHLDAPPGVPKVLGAEPQDLLPLLLPRAAFPYARFDIAGTEHVPRRGAVIVVANHRSYFDPVAMIQALYDSGRRPRGLGKKEVFDAPVVGPLVRALGGISVDRKGDPSTALQAAEQALRAGECVALMPEGTIPRGEQFFEPKLAGKTGAARLAAATGAKVVPMGLWNTEAVWPRSSRVPNVTNLLHPPKVRVRIGPPVRGLTGTDMVADTETIMEAIVAQLPPEARLPRIPNAEEMARTMPPA